MSVDARHVTVIRPRLPGLGERLREINEHRRLIPYFGRRAVSRLYARTVLGRAWLFLRPCIGVVARAFFFGGVLSAPSDGVPYLLFLLFGTAAWTAFDRTLLWVTRSIEMNRRLVSQVYFPRLVLPLASLAPGAVEVAILGALSLLAAAGYGLADGQLYVNTDWHLLYVPLALALLFAFAIGIGWWTSVLGAATRDMRWTLRYGLEVVFFVTPVAYTLNGVPAGYRDIVAHNPLTPLIELFRLGIFGRGDVDGTMLGISLGILVLVWVGGLTFFMRAEAASVDRI